MDHGAIVFDVLGKEAKRALRVKSPCQSTAATFTIHVQSSWMSVLGPQVRLLPCVSWLLRKKHSQTMNRNVNSLV